MKICSTFLFWQVEVRGSFNFAKVVEENNAENLIVIREQKLAERYTRNWQEHDRHSEAYGGRGKLNLLSYIKRFRGSTTN